MQMHHRIKGTRRILVTGIVALVASLAIGLSAPAANATTKLRNQVFGATNSSRTSHGEHRLQLNQRLSNIARRHSLAMARAGTLFHTTNVNVYLHHVKWTSWGENVGMTTLDVPTLEKAFMHSTEHKHNILNGAFAHVAVGAVHRNGALWVTVFFYG
jgi:uncharacterized protein YkwD